MQLCDKAAHAFGSYSLSLTTSLILRKLDVARWQAVLIGGASTLALGTFKELVLDERYSWLDQAANASGVAASTLFVFTFEL